MIGQAHGLITTGYNRKNKWGKRKCSKCSSIIIFASWTKLSGIWSDHSTVRCSGCEVLQKLTAVEKSATRLLPGTGHIMLIPGLKLERTVQAENAQINPVDRNAAKLLVWKGSAYQCTIGL